MTCSSEKQKVCRSLYGAFINTRLILNVYYIPTARDFCNFLLLYMKGVRLIYFLDFENPSGGCSVVQGGVLLISCIWGALKGYRGRWKNCI